MTLRLTPVEQAMLDGSEGEGVALAMRIVTGLARVRGAEELVDVTGAHIDSCLYHGRAGLDFAEKLVDLGGVGRGPDRGLGIGLGVRAAAGRCELVVPRPLPTVVCDRVRIRELRALEKDLKALRARCTSPHAVADCGILDGIDRAAAGNPVPSPRRRHVHGAH